jgi:hypothetical protein
MRLPLSTVQEQERRHNLYCFSMLEAKERVCVCDERYRNEREMEGERRRGKKEQSNTEINRI